MRRDGREAEEPRALNCETSVNRYAEGSCIFEMGNTRVHCTASVSEDVPRWRRDSGMGWVTAEYRMLPRSTDTRTRREGSQGIKGRTAEIQRLVGRALRAGVDMKALGPRVVTIDCDVLQADGGTRTASVNGGFVAMAQAFQRLVEKGKLNSMPLLHSIAAVSVGLVDGKAIADLCYEEDVSAQVDMNLVLTGDGQIVEVQGTAEHGTFSPEQLHQLVEVGHRSIREVTRLQRQALGGLPGLE